MNSNYNDMFGSAGSHGQDGMTSNQLYLQAMMSNTMTAQHQNYRGAMLTGQLPASGQPSQNIALQLHHLQQREAEVRAAAAADYRQPDIQRQQQMELLQQQQHQALLRQQLAQHQRLNQRPRASAIIPHKSAPTQYSYQQQMQQNSSSPLSNANADIARPLSNSSHGMTPSPNQQHVMDYSSNHQPHRPHQPQPQSQMREARSFTAGAELNLGSQGHRSSSQYMSLPSSQPQPVHSQNPQQSPHDLSSQTHIRQSMSTSSSGLGPDTTPVYQTSDISKTISSESISTNRPSNKLPQPHVPYKMDSMMKNKTVDDLTPQSHNPTSHVTSSINSDISNQPSKVINKSSSIHNKQHPPQRQQSPGLRKPAANYVAFKMGAMRRTQANAQQQQQQKAARSPAATVSSDQPVHSTAHTVASSAPVPSQSSKAGPSSTTTSTTNTSSADSIVPQRKPRVSSYIPFKAAPMKKSNKQSDPLGGVPRPPISRHVPYKAAPMKKSKQPAPTSVPNQDVSTSSSSDSSSSSSSSSDESEDEETAAKPGDQQDANAVVSSAPTKTFHPPVRSIPFKKAGSSAPKPAPFAAGPVKKPMGKPLTMMKEKVKETHGPPKPKHGGKPDSMLKMLEKEELEKSNQSVSITSPPTSANKRRGRPAKSGTTGSPTKHKSEEDLAATQRLTRSDSQFEAISDSEAPPGKPAFAEPAKRKRGRPPKNKGKETPSQSKETVAPPDSPGLPPTPAAFDMMPPTPRFEPPSTPQAPPTPQALPTHSVQNTPNLAMETSPFPHYDMMSMKKPLETPAKSPPKRGRRKTVRKTADENVMRSDENIMDIVNDVTKSLKSNEDNEDAPPFDLDFKTPSSTPSMTPHNSLTSLQHFTPSSSSMLQSPAGGMTPVNLRHPTSIPSIPAHTVPAQPISSASCTSAVARENNPELSNAKKVEESKKRPGGRRKGRRKHAPPPPPQVDPMEPESPPSVFAGINDLPPMDVSGESFRLDSRMKKPDSTNTAAVNDTDKKPTDAAEQQNRSTQQNELFKMLNLEATSEKIAGDEDDEEPSLPHPDAHITKGKKKKSKKHDSRKPYKRPGKIKHLDPIFIADMEDLSKGVETCCLYEIKPDLQLPVHIRAFGEYALVHPPVPENVPKPMEESQSQNVSVVSTEQVTEEPKAEKLRIKVKFDEIKPPSFDELGEEKSDILSPDKELTTPVQSEPVPLSDKEASVSVEESEIKKPEDPKDKKSKPDGAKYDASLSANEVAQKYYVSRPKSRIATKNISFSSRKKKPKYGGKVNSPRSGASPHLSDADLGETERRQLPARKSRPQHPFESDGNDDLITDENIDTINTSPVKRGRGRPPKSETEIPHTNLVRTNDMFLPLKKRHKMVLEDYNDELPLEPPSIDDELESGVPSCQDSHLAERPGSGLSRKRPASSGRQELEIPIDNNNQDSLDGTSKKKRRVGPGVSENKPGQAFSNLVALQAAMEAHLRSKTKLDNRQLRKNSSPTKKASDSSQKLSSNAFDDFDQENSNDSTSDKLTAKDQPAKKKNAKSNQGKSQALQYKKINKCVYSSGIKPLVPGYEPHGCACVKPPDPRAKSCHEDCLNRMVYIECTSQTCPCGEQCANMRIQKQTTAHGLEKIQTPDRGFGVKTTNFICSGEFILEYTGEVVTIDEFRQRMAMEYARDHHHYCLTLDSKFVIDGYRMGNIGRFVNHSCDPNCEMQKWNVNGVYRIGLFALRDIRPGEELTYDYNFKAFNMDAQQKCHCGSSNCRGIMGGKSQNIAGIPKTKKKAKGLSNSVNPKDPLVRRQRAIMMPVDEKKFIRSRQCFLLRSMLGKLPVVQVAKRASATQPYKMLLPFKTEEKIPSKEYRVPSKAETDGEEVIRCICGVLREEGDMLMCDKCEVWQHCDCVRVKPDVESYLCDQCSAKQMSGEVEMVPPPPDGIPEYKYYLSLEHGDVHVAIGDAVYMTPSDPNLGIYSYRIERLWKDPRGDKYVYGFFYYLPWKLPNRTETMKKFYPNEVVQTMFYDILPLRNVRAHCYVVDEGSYCEGRPKDYTGEKDIFICEYKMDKLHKELRKIAGRRETEMVNKFHYAFNYFKKPLKLTQQHSHVLKKAYDAPKREVKQPPQTKIKKKSQPVSAEKVMRRLAGKYKTELVDVNSITKSLSHDRPKTVVLEKQINKLQTQSALSASDVGKDVNKTPIIPDTLRATSSSPTDIKKTVGKAKEIKSAAQDKDAVKESPKKPGASKKEADETKRSSKKREGRKPPEKRQASPKGKKTKDTAKTSKEVLKPPPAASLPRIPKRKPAAAASEDLAKTEEASLRRGRSGTNKSPEKEETNKSVPLGEKADKLNERTKDSTVGGRKDAVSSEKVVQTKEHTSQVDKSKTAKEAVLRLQKVDKSAAAEKLKTVQVTISTKDLVDLSSVSTSVKPSIQSASTKSTTSVKRAEPGKAPILSDLLSGGEGNQQQATPEEPPSKKQKTSSMEKSDNVELNQTQKRGILKNAVVRISPVPVEKLQTETGSTQQPLSSHTQKPETETPASPPPELQSGKELPKPPTVINESPASPKQDTHTPNVPPQPPNTSSSVRTKKVVAIADVLKRAKEKEAREKEEKEKAAAIAASTPPPLLMPSSPLELQEPESPKATNDSEITSPTSDSMYKAPRVIPLIPLSPTRDNVQELDSDLPADPIAIPLSPSAQEKVIPLSPTEPTKLSGNLSASDASSSAVTCIIPLSPTAAGSSLIEREKTDADAESAKTSRTAFLQSTDEDDSDSEPMLSIAEDLELTPVKKQADSVSSQDQTTVLPKDGDQSKAVSGASESEERSSVKDSERSLSSEGGANTKPEEVRCNETETKSDLSVENMLSDFFDKPPPHETSNQSSSDDLKFAPVFGPQSTSLVSGDSWRFSTSIVPLKRPKSARPDSDDSSEEDANSSQLPAQTQSDSDKEKVGQDPITPLTASSMDVATSPEINSGEANPTNISTSSLVTEHYEQPIEGSLSENDVSKELDKESDGEMSRSPRKPASPLVHEPSNKIPADEPVIEPSTSEPTPSELPADEPPSVESPVSEPTSSELPADKPPSVELPVSEPTPVELPADELPSVESPVSEPTPVELSADEPPSVESPVSEPTSSELPADEPPSVESPVSEPIPSELPTDKPPSVELPVSEPTPVELPADEPPSVESPVSEPTSSELPADEPPSVESPVSEPIPSELPTDKPPSVESPVSEPTSSELPANEHPSFESPVSEPTSSELPADEPPSVESPVSEPIPSELPADKPPSVELPVSEPTPVELPADEPPSVESPVSEPTSSELPADEPPSVESPVSEPIPSELPADEPPSVESPVNESTPAGLPANEPPFFESPVSEPIPSELPADELPSVESPVSEPTPVELPADEPPTVESPVSEPIPSELPADEPPSIESPVNESTPAGLPADEPPSIESPLSEPSPEDLPAHEPPFSADSLPPTEESTSETLTAEPPVDGVLSDEAKERCVDLPIDSALPTQQPPLTQPESDKLLDGEKEADHSSNSQSSVSNEVKSNLTNKASSETKEDAEPPESNYQMIHSTAWLLSSIMAESTNSSAPETTSAEDKSDETSGGRNTVDDVDAVGSKATKSSESKQTNKQSVPIASSGLALLGGYSDEDGNSDSSDSDCEDPVSSQIPSAPILRGAGLDKTGEATESEINASEQPMISPKTDDEAKGFDATDGALVPSNIPDVTSVDDQTLKTSSSIGTFESPSTGGVELGSSHVNLHSDEMLDQSEGAEHGEKLESDEPEDANTDEREVQPMETSQVNPLRFADEKDCTENTQRTLTDLSGSSSDIGGNVQSFEVLPPNDIIDATTNDESLRNSPSNEGPQNEEAQEEEVPLDSITDSKTAGFVLERDDDCMHEQSESGSNKLVTNIGDEQDAGLVSRLERHMSCQRLYELASSTNVDHVKKASSNTPTASCDVTASPTERKPTAEMSPHHCTSEDSGSAMSVVEEYEEHSEHAETEKNRHAGKSSVDDTGEECSKNKVEEESDADDDLNKSISNEDVEMDLDESRVDADLEDCHVPSSSLSDDEMAQTEDLPQDSTSNVTQLHETVESHHETPLSQCSFSATGLTSSETEMISHESNPAEIKEENVSQALSESPICGAKTTETGNTSEPSEHVDDDEEVEGDAWPSGIDRHTATPVAPTEDSEILDQPSNSTMSSSDSQMEYEESTTQEPSTGDVNAQLSPEQAVDDEVSATPISSDSHQPAEDTAGDDTVLNRPPSATHLQRERIHSAQDDDNDYLSENVEADSASGCEMLSSVNNQNKSNQQRLDYEGVDNSVQETNQQLASENQDERPTDQLDEAVVDDTSDDVVDDTTDDVAASQSADDVADETTDDVVDDTKENVVDTTDDVVDDTSDDVVDDTTADVAASQSADDVVDDATADVVDDTRENVVDDATADVAASQSADDSVADTVLDEQDESCNNQAAQKLRSVSELAGSCPDELPQEADECLEEKANVTEKVAEDVVEGIPTDKTVENQVTELETDRQAGSSPAVLESHDSVSDPVCEESNETPEISNDTDTAKSSNHMTKGSDSLCCDIQYQVSEMEMNETAPDVDDGLVTEREKQQNVTKKLLDESSNELVDSSIDAGADKFLDQTVNESNVEEDPCDELTKKSLSQQSAEEIEDTNRCVEDSETLHVDRRVDLPMEQTEYAPKNSDCAVKESSQLMDQTRNLEHPVSSVNPDFPKDLSHQHETDPADELGEASMECPPPIVKDEETAEHAEDEIGCSTETAELSNADLKKNENNRPRDTLQADCSPDDTSDPTKQPSPNIVPVRDNSETIKDDLISEDETNPTTDNQKLVSYCESSSECDDEGMEHNERPSENCLMQTSLVNEVAREYSGVERSKRSIQDEVLKLSDNDEVQLVLTEILDKIVNGA